MTYEFFFVIVIIFIIVVIVGLGFLLYYLKTSVFNKAGKGAEKKTTRILNQFGAIRRFRTLSNLTLRVDGKTAHIENLLIGYFGILVVTTCGAQGGYYGTLDAPNWVLARDEQKEGGGSRATFPNPYLAQREAVSLLRTVLSKNKLYNIPVEHIVYLSSPARGFGCYITNNGEIILPGKLSNYLHKSKFEKDIGLDVPKIAEAIQAGAGS